MSEGTRRRGVTGVLLLLALLVGAGLLALALWLTGVIGTSGSSSTSTTAMAAPAGDIPVGVPTVVSVKQLQELAGSRGPIYWAGQRRNTKLEVTVTTKGAVFVRYLPQDASAGTKSKYLTVGTYDDNVGYTALTSASAKRASVVKAKSGAVIATFKKEPTSTYFSFPQAAFQVEVYAPRPWQSRKMTDAGQIQLVTAGH